MGGDWPFLSSLDQGDTDLGSPSLVCLHKPLDLFPGRSGGQKKKKIDHTAVFGGVHPPYKRQNLEEVAVLVL